MRIRICLTVLIIIHILILLKLTFFPYPELFVYPYLTNNGLKPYSQILDQHFPGLMFLPVNLGNLGMTTPEVARVWLMATVVLTHLLIFITCKYLLKSEKKALIVNGLYLLWQPFFEGGVLWVDSFLPPILVSAFYFSLKFLGFKKLKYSFLVGLILGVGIVFKQVVIPLSFLLLIYFFWQTKNFKVAVYFLLGVLTPIILMLVYLASINVWHDFIYWTITFNLTTFAQYGKKAPTIGGLLRVGFVLAASTPAFLWRDRKMALLLFIFIIGSLVAIYTRFDLVHFQPALPFVLIATTIGFIHLRKLMVGKLAILEYLVVTVWWMMIFYKGNLSDKVLFFDNQILEVADKVEKQTHPGEKIFIFGAPPHLYQITQTLPVGDVFVFQFPWFMMVAEDRVLEGIKKDKPSIVVSDRSVEIEGQKITNFASKIDKYIQGNYQMIDQVGDTKILQRK